MREIARRPAPWEGAAELQPCYCHGKLVLHVVDMLTYPRPVRKFEVSHLARGVECGTSEKVHDVYADVGVTDGKREMVTCTLGLEW